MSPSLLSQRLKELEVAGIVSRGPADDEPSVQEYRLTKAGHDLQSIVEAFGIWGQKWIETQATLENLDPSLLMWDMRRNLDPSPLPDRRTVISFLYPELAGGRRHWWLVVEPFGAVDLCSTDPGYDVDLWVTTNLRTMTEIWMGLARVDQVRDKIQFEGDPAMASTMQTWLGLSPFSSQSKLVH